MREFNGGFNVSVLDYCVVFIVIHVPVTAVSRFLTVH